MQTLKTAAVRLGKIALALVASVLTMALLGFASMLLAQVAADSNGFSAPALYGHCLAGLVGAALFLRGCVDRSWKKTVLATGILGVAILGGTEAGFRQANDQSSILHWQDRAETAEHKISSARAAAYEEVTRLERKLNEREDALNRRADAVSELAEKTAKAYSSFAADLENHAAEARSIHTLERYDSRVARTLVDRLPGEPLGPNGRPMH